MKNLKLFFILFIVLFYSSSQGKEFTIISDFLQKTTSEKKGKGAVVYRNYSYLSTPIHSSSTQSLEMRLSGKNYDLATIFTPGQQGLAYSVAQVYWEKKMGDISYSLGRKILSWPPNESIWGMGHLNGLEGFTPMRPRAEGLTGFHASLKKGPMELQFFASIFFIPQLNPAYKVENGKIVSKGPWGIIVPETLIFGNGQAPIAYQIEVPNSGEIVEDIILNESVALYGAYNFENGKLKGKLTIYGGYKPENQLRWHLYGFYEQAEEERVVIKVKNFVNHHSFVGIRLNHHYGPISWYNGFQFFRPRRGSPFPTKNNYSEREQNYSDERYITSSIFFNWNRGRVGLHYLKSYGNQKTKESIFDKLSPWRHALGTTLQFWPHRKWQIMMDYRRDILFKNTIAKGEINYFLNPFFRVGLRGEVIQAPIMAHNYWSSFRRNDSIQGHIAYYF